MSLLQTLKELFVAGLFSHNQWLEISENGIFSLEMWGVTKVVRM